MLNKAAKIIIFFQKATLFVIDLVTLHTEQLANIDNMTLCFISLLFGNLGLSEVLIIAFVVLLLFGGKKIPELMRGIGKGVSSFRQGMNEIQDEIKKPIDDKQDAGKQ